MVIYIEIRKIEKDFGSDKWAVRFGDIVGSTDMHNISRTELIGSIMSEIEDEAKREDPDGEKDKSMLERIKKILEVKR